MKAACKLCWLGKVSFVDVWEGSELMWGERPAQYAKEQNTQAYCS